MAQQQSDAHRDNARLWKAIRLADWLSANAADMIGTPEAIAALSGMPKLWWKGVAAHAGTNPPRSDETLNLVMQLLEERRTAAERRHLHPADPLEGLPGYEGTPVLKGCADV